MSIKKGSWDAISTDISEADTEKKWKEAFSTQITLANATH